MGRSCYYNKKGGIKMPNSIKYDSKLILNKLIEVIRESGLSYGEIARRTGIPKSSIHRYVNGQTKKIPIDAVRLISEATGVSTSYIMGREDKQEECNSPKPKITENIDKHINIIKIAGRDGSYEERALTDEQVELFKKMIAALPEATDL